MLGYLVYLKPNIRFAKDNIPAKLDSKSGEKLSHEDSIDRKTEKDSLESEAFRFSKSLNHVIYTPYK